MLRRMGDGDGASGGKPPDDYARLLEHLRGVPSTSSSTDGLREAVGDLFRVLAENVPGTVYLCRNDEAYSMLYLSQRVTELTGLPPQDFLDGRVSVVDLYHPDDATRVVPIVDAALEARRPFHLEYRLLHADGSYRHVEEYGQGVWDSGGTLVFLEGALFDVTARRTTERERRRLEQQLFAAQKLDSLGLLAGGIAHDFNNLLQAIIPNLLMVLDDLGEGDERREPLEDALVASKQAAQLTGQMLAYAGRSVTASERLDLVTLVRDLGPLARSAASKKVEVRVDTPDAPVVVEGDSAQIRQVVMNLAINACEAVGDAPGRVTLRVDTTKDPAHGDDDGVRWLPNSPLGGSWARVTVIDDGVGMDADLALRIFDPFFTTKRSGHGLGLAAVLGIVSSHAGHLGLVSSPGRGTTFSLLLRSTHAEAPATTGASARRESGGERVLVVDDEAQVRRASTRVLTRAGYSVCVAPNGAACLELLRAGERFDVILLDMNMPTFGGAETFRGLRALGVTTPVLFSSGFDASSSVDELLREPGTAFLQKPHEPDALVGELSKLIAAAAD